MKAKRVIIGALLLLLLLGGTYIYRRGGDFRSLSGAYASGGDGGSGIGRFATSLWMTMVNTELGVKPGQGRDGAGNDATAGGLDGLPPGYGTGDTQTAGGQLAVEPGYGINGDGGDGGLDQAGQALPEGGVPGTADGIESDPYARAGRPGAAPAPGSAYNQSSSMSIGERIAAWLFGDARNRRAQDNRVAYRDPAHAGQNGYADGTAPDGAGPSGQPGATPAAAPVPGMAYSQSSSMSIGQRIASWFYGDAPNRNRINRNGDHPAADQGRLSGNHGQVATGAGGYPASSNGGVGAVGQPGRLGPDGQPGAAPMPAPAPGVAYNDASSMSFGERIAGFFFGNSSGNNRNNREDARGQAASGARSANPNAVPGPGSGLYGDASSTNLDGAAAGTEGIGGPDAGDPMAPGDREVAALNGGQNAGPDGTRTARRDQPAAIPRAGNFGARIQDREAIIERQGPVMDGVGFPVTMQEARSLQLRAFLGRTHRAHSNWYRRRSELIGEYNQARARDRAAIQRSFNAARARDRRDGSQTHLRKFMTESRQFNRRRAAQNGRFQNLLDRTGARIGRRFQLLFHVNLRRHIARQEKETRSEPRTKDDWRRLKRETMATAAGVYADGRVPAQSRGVNRGVRNYMAHWIGYFYDKKIRGAGDPEPAPDEPIREEPVRVEKFEPEENCGPEDLHTYKLERMRRYIKSLPANCAAGNGLPDLLLKTCARYHVQIDLKVSCKRDIYYFLKFDSENTYDRNQALDHFNEGCRPYRSAADLAQIYTNDPNRGIDSLQKDKMNRMLKTMRSCSPGSVGPAPARKAPIVAPVNRPPAVETPGANRPAPDTRRDEPARPEVVPENMPGKEPEAAPEPVEDVPAEAPENTESQPDDEPSAEEILGIPDDG